MKSIKYLLPLVVLFLSIGYAATNVTLSMSGDAAIASDIDDFDVYISDISLDGETTDISLLDSTTSFFISGSQTTALEWLYIYFDLTNSSQHFDALIDYSCETDESTSLEHYVIVNNETQESLIDPFVLASSETSTYKMEFGLSGNASDTYNISCKITAEPIERTELGTGETPDSLKPPKVIYFDSDSSGYIDTGDVVNISGEKFNILSADDENVVMFAQYNLGTDYKQSTTQNKVVYADEAGWEYTPGPKEIDVDTWLPYIATYINKYETILNELTETTNITTDLITISQLIELGYDIDPNYTIESITNLSSDIKYTSWLKNNQDWYTKSASSNIEGVFFYYSIGDGGFGGPTSLGYALAGVRPTVTIPYDTFKELSKTSKNSLISFSIDSVKCQAEIGMTWEEWINSSFNTRGLIIRSSNISGASGMGTVSTQSNIAVLTNDIIINKAQYIISFGGGSA